MDLDKIARRLASGGQTNRFQSGDPMKSGGFDFNMQILPESTDDMKSFQVKGTIGGEIVDGVAKIHLEDGEFSGSDWASTDPSAGELDENIFQVILDSIGEELGI